MEISIFEMYLLTRLLHIGAIATGMFWIAALMIVLGVVSAICKGADEEADQKIGKGWIKWPFGLAVASILVGSLINVLAIGSNAEAAVIIAVPAATQMVDTETLGEEAGEWNDLVQRAVEQMIDGEDVEAAIDGAIEEATNTE